MPLRYGWLPVGDEEIRFLEGGEGPPIVFLHGALGSLEMWKPAAEILSKEFFVFAFDWPGFGSSRKNNVPYSISYFADFLRAVLERRKFSRPTLVGTSLGARVALEFALRYPTEIDRLVLAAPAGILGKPWSSEALVSFIVFRELWLRLGLRPSSIRKILAREMPVSHPRFRFLFESNPAFHDGGERRLWIRAFARSVRSLMTHSAENRLSGVCRPTLVLSGTNDRHHPLEASREIKNKIPAACFEVLEGAGHFLMLERAEEFAKIVSNFIQQSVNV